MDPVAFGDRLVGPGHPPYVIAEIGSNHNGDIELAKEMIRVAKERGADCVKFQSWTEDSLVGRKEYERNTSYDDTHRHFGSLQDMVRAYQFTPEQHRAISAYCKELGIHFASSAFSAAEADLLLTHDVPFIKVASMDVNHLPLLRHLAGCGVPIVISTGMARLGEIERAVQTLKEHGDPPVVLLHCISIYPPAMEDVNLRNIPSLAAAFGVPVGFSDHSRGVHVPLAAIALGACVVEKHYTLDTDMEGWDHWISATPDQLEAIVSQGREIQVALGSSARVVSEAEQAKRLKFRRRAVLAADVAEGARITEADLTFVRPGNGIGPHELQYLVGRVAARALAKDDELEWSDLV